MQLDADGQREHPSSPGVPHLKNTGRKGPVETGKPAVDKTDVVTSAEGRGERELLCLWFPRDCRVKISVVEWRVILPLSQSLCSCEAAVRRHVLALLMLHLQFLLPLLPRAPIAVLTTLTLLQILLLWAGAKQHGE